MTRKSRHRKQLSEHIRQQDAAILGEESVGPEEVTTTAPSSTCSFEDAISMQTLIPVDPLQSIPHPVVTTTTTDAVVDEQDKAAFASEQATLNESGPNDEMPGEVQDPGNNSMEADAFTTSSSESPDSLVDPYEVLRSDPAKQRKIVRERAIARGQEPPPLDGKDSEGGWCLACCSIQ